MAAGLTLPQTSSDPLRRTRAGLLWRVVARAARTGEWSGWDGHVEAELAATGTPEPEARLVWDDGEVSLADLLADASLPAGALDVGAVELCHGLRYYLESLPVGERVRSAGRIGALLHLVSQRTPLDPFAHLDAVPEGDQVSIWDSVLRALVAAEGDAARLQPWLAHLSHLPDSLRPRWRDQLAGVELAPATREHIVRQLEPPVPAPAPLVPEPEHAPTEAPAASQPPETVPAAQDSTEKPTVPLARPHAAARTAPMAPAAAIPASAAVGAAQPGAPEPASQPPREAAPAIGGRSAEDQLADHVEALGSERAPAASPTTGRAEHSSRETLPAVPAAMDSARTGTATAGTGPRVPRLAPATAEGAGDEVEEDEDDLNPDLVTTQRELPVLRLSEGADDEGISGEVEAVPSEESAEAAAAAADRRRPRSRRRAREAVEPELRLELRGGFAGKPLPRVVRVLGVVTGLIVVAAVVRILLRFVLGWRRVGELSIEDGRVTLDSTTFFLGREVRRIRRGFGPRGLLTVAREVRYPYLFLFLGLFALCLGTLAGTVAFLDGRLAGFEEWMRIGLMLIIGGLVVDFLFTVLAASRPGRTTLILTFEPRTTVRLLGVKQAEADKVLEALARLAQTD